MKSSTEEFYDHVQFVYIASDLNGLRAIDKNGRVWSYVCHYDKAYNETYYWCLLEHEPPAKAVSPRSK